MIWICSQEGHLLLSSIQSPPKEILYNRRERRRPDLYHGIPMFFWSLPLRVSSLGQQGDFRFMFGYYTLDVEPLGSGVSRRRRRHGHGSND